MSTRLTDPIERMVADALTEAGIEFTTGPPPGTPPGSPLTLDFHLPGPDVFIEVKQFHSNRIAAQMARAPNVIAVQGERAAEWFCQRLQGRAP